MKLRLAVGTLLVAGAAYFAMFGGEYTFFELRAVRAEHALEAARLDSARADVARLQARADLLQRDSAAIEQIARERYGLIRPGERLYRFGERLPAAASAASAAN